MTSGRSRRRGAATDWFPSPPLPGETLSTVFTHGFSGLFWLFSFEQPKAQQVGVTRGIPDVWRVHNLSAPRGDQSDQSRIPAAAPGDQGSTWTRRASARSRDHPYSEQPHNRCLFSSKRKTGFSMKAADIQHLTITCTTSRARQTDSYTIGYTKRSPQS